MLEVRGGLEVGIRGFFFMGFSFISIRREFLEVIFNEGSVGLG